MRSARVLEAMELVDSFDRVAATLIETKEAVTAVRIVRGWLDARMLDITARLSEVSPLPSDDLATGSRSGQRAADAALKRAAAAAAMPEFARKLGDGSISTDHLDAAARGMRSLPAKDRAAFAAQAGRLAAIAGQTTPEQFEKTVKRTADAISSESGTDRLARQKAAARLRMGTDKDTDMFWLSGRFDPETGARLAAKIDAVLASKFADATPEGCPEDPSEKQDWLRAQALTAIMLDGKTVAGGRPEMVVVVDTTTGVVRWPFDVTLPDEALQRFIARADVYFVDIHLGGLRHAPGNLDLGHSSRMANRAQRRAMQALYATCAVPGCCVRFENTELHHLKWWRHGGRTDFNNLLPLCFRHHEAVHHAGLIIEMAADRSLRITRPDGTIETTGPPGQRSPHQAAAA